MMEKRKPNKRRMIRKAHNAVLRTITLVAAVALVIGAIGTDNATNCAELTIPFWMITLSALWILLFFYANNE